MVMHRNPSRLTAFHCRQASRSQRPDRPGISPEFPVYRICLMQLLTLCACLGYKIVVH